MGKPPFAPHLGRCPASDCAAQQQDTPFAAACKPRRPAQIDRGVRMVRTYSPEFPVILNIRKFVLEILPLQWYTVISADELQRALHRLT